MACLKFAVAMAAVTFLAAQPCAAAPGSAGWNEPTAGMDERRMAAFAGLNIRMSLWNAKPARPSARLQLTSSYHVRDVRKGSVQTLKAQGLEIGSSGKGAPTLYLNGQSTAEIKQKAQLSSSTPDAVWIVFGVALVVVGVVVSSGLDDLKL